MGFSATISFPQGDPRQKLDALKRKMYDGLIDGVTEVCDLILARAVQNLTASGRIDRGTLRASGNRSISGKPTSVEGTVRFSAAYAQWVERGRHGRKSDPPGLAKFPEGSRFAAQAAWPPVSVIRQWVERHARTLAPSGRTKSGRARKAKRQDIDSLAFLIGRKIAERGIKPSPFLIPAVDEILPRAQTIIAARVKERLGR